VHDPSPRQSDARLARELVEQLLRASLTLTDMLASLIEELPEDAFPGEDNAAVLLEMVAGTCAPVVGAVGEASCREAIALIAAVQDRILSDLEAAARLAAELPPDQR
jgi:hypothetical protein